MKYIILLLIPTFTFGALTSVPWIRNTVNSTGYYSVLGDNLGIGLTDPLTKLAVAGTASTSVLRIDSLADGCLNITSGLVGRLACATGGNSKWATTSDTFGIFTNGASYLGIGSSTPWATLAVNPVAGKASNQFVVGSSTATAFLIDNSGRVGIGTTTPGTAQFQIEEPLGSQISLLVGDNGSSTAQFIVTGNKVGVGTSSPYAALSVQGYGDTAANSKPGFALFGGNAGGNSAFKGGGGMLQGGVGGSASGVAGAGGDIEMFGGLGGNGSTVGTGGDIYIGGGLPLSGQAVGSIILGMDLGKNNRGNVGIGTTTPREAKLFVSASSTGSKTDLIRAETKTNDGTQSSTSTMFVIDENGNLGVATDTPFAVASINASSTKHSFVVGSSTKTDFIITNAGRTGIATTSPAYKLDVNGHLLLEPVASSTTVHSGTIWNDSSQNQIAYSNGNTLYQGGSLYTSQADVTLNSATPTTAFSTNKLGTTTIDANSLKVGQKFSIWGAGYYSTPIGNTATVTITPSIASSTATNISTVTTAIFPASATNLPYDFRLNCTIRSLGAIGTLVCDGTFNYATALTGVSPTSNSLSTVGTIPFDSTVRESLDVKVNWSAVTTQTATVQEVWITFP